MTRIALVIMGCLTLASTDTGAGTDQVRRLPAISTTRPPILEKFLQQNPDYHLLTPSDVDDVDTKQAIATGEPPAFLLADTNRDAKIDVVAVVVKDKLFNVVVLQAKERAASSATPYWLVRDSTDVIAGIYINGDYMVPAYCIACDGLSTYAWTGSEYGKNVTLKGHFQCIGYDAVIYSKDDEHSVPVYKTTTPAGAYVLELGRHQGDLYWHKIKLDSGQIGFVLNNEFDNDYGCADQPN